MNADQITQILKDSVETPAMWSPGATELGWSFHVEDDHLFVNSALGKVYKERLGQFLPVRLPGVEIKFTRDPRNP